MSERRYCQIHATLDLEGLQEYPNGVRVLEIELVLGDDPEVPFWRAAEPAVCAIDARRARELAFELLQFAEVAERWERAR
jgi:hypothetical protein